MSSYTELREAGYGHALADALSELGYTLERAALLPQHDLVDAYLRYNGIIGYTTTILDVVAIAERKGA